MAVAVVMYGRVGELWFCRHSSLARGPTHISLTNNQKQASAQGRISCHPKTCIIWLFQRKYMASVYVAKVVVAYLQIAGHSRNPNEDAISGIIS